LGVLGQQVLLHVDQSLPEVGVPFPADAGTAEEGELRHHDNLRCGSG
jgi:hypothetical protein